MARILLLLVIALLIWLIFRGFFRVQTRKDAAPAATAAGEPMVACARCGVHLPKSEAQAQGSLFYCRENPRCLAPK